MVKTALLLGVLLTSCTVAFDNAQNVVLEVSEYPTRVVAPATFNVVIDALNASDIETSIVISGDGVSVDEQLGKSYVALLVSVSDEAEPGLKTLEVEVIERDVSGRVSLGFEVEDAGR